MQGRPVVHAILVALVGLSATGTAWAQAETRSGHFTTSDGVRLHYLEAGSGPALVFVPGWTMPAEIWEHQIRHFAATHRVIALDPRGHGRSEKASFGYQPSRRARDIGELLDHLGGEPAVLVGWSLGVQEVVLYAHEHGTGRIRGAVLVDWDINWEGIEGLTQRFIALQVNREEWTRDFVRAIHRSPQTEAYLEGMTAAALSTPTNASAIMIANLILMGPTDLRDVLGDLDWRVLYVYSSQDWALAAAEEVRGAWPGARVDVIDETSHALFVDQPAAFNRVLESFIATLPD